QHDEQSRQLNDLPQKWRRVEFHDTTGQTPRDRIVFSILLRARFPHFRGPRLIWRTVFQAHADVEKLERHLHIGASLGRAWPVFLRLPDSGKIRFAVRGSWRGCLKIGRSVGQSRDSGSWIYKPLSTENRWQRRRDDQRQARKSADFFHPAITLWVLSNG